MLLDSSLFKTSSYINGVWSTAKDLSTFSVRNPYSGEEIAQVSNCGITETEQAIHAASEAFISWRKLTGTERGQILRRWYELQIEHLDKLAYILTMEQGKALAEAKGEIKYGASFVEWFAEEARRAYGDTIPGHQQDKRIMTIKQPIGVVAAITPWNFPNAMIARKVAPALAAGCTVVVKPSELTPLSALALAVLAEEAGIPKGVFNVVTSANASEVGRVLCEHKSVKKLSFTGSTPVGKILLRQCADTVKKVSLELGGNAPFIVFDDADLDAAVEGAIASKYRNAGQTCVCTNRIFVQASIYDKFVQKLTIATKTLKTGSGLDEDTYIGPMIEEKAVTSVLELIEEAISNGAKVETGGDREGQDSLILNPTVLSNVTPSMKIFSEEIFGPVAPVFRFDTEEEVMDLANDTPFGLASYFYGSDYARIWRVAEALEYGMVGINTGMISTTVAPFGGIKESGFGREGSKYGMDDYLNIKYMCWGGIS